MNRKRSFSVSSALPSRRNLAWAFFLLILGAFLIVPVVSNLTRAAGPKAAVMGDGSWSSGPLSAAHHALEGDCTACHVKPFEAVRDTACKACHETAHDHAPPARLDLARAHPGPGGRFLLKVAHAFGKPGTLAPASIATPNMRARGPCSRSGKSSAPIATARSTTAWADSSLGNASDFGKVHPEFRALVAAGRDRETPLRARLAGGPSRSM